MGYPMTFRRLVERNYLEGDYNRGSPKLNNDQALNLRCMIAGDLRRLELDTRDENHLVAYAQIGGTTSEVVKKIFDVFFETDANLGVARSSPAKELLNRRAGDNGDVD